MKKLILTSVLLSLITSPIYAAEKNRPEEPAKPVYALDEHQHNDKAKSPAPKIPANPQMDKMKDLQKKMQGQMSKMQQAKDPQERQKLMHEHMQSMHEGMQMMGKMDGGMTMGEDKNMGSGKMENRMGKIENKMQMMQMMMEQMMMHQSAQSIK